MSEYLVVVDAVAPVAQGEPAVTAAGLAQALVGAKHKVTLLSLAASDHVAQLPGMARRLRTVAATARGAALDLPLFEGRSGQAHLYVLGTAMEDRGYAGAVLASAAASLARDGLVKPDVIIGWGEASAASLSTVGASTRLFVLPTGVAGKALNAREWEALGPEALDPLGVRSLAALGAAGAEAVVVPSPSSVRTLEGEPALSGRASDQPLVAARFGCDEPPFDPANDPALPTGFSADAPAGKADCRRALARRTSLALGPRTLLLATGPLDAERGGQAVVNALGRLAKLDVAIVVAAGGDRALTDQANVLAIEHPGKVAVLGGGTPGGDRLLLAGADAYLSTDERDQTGRATGLALRYGTLPIALDRGASSDFLVDHDASSATGSALLVTLTEPFELEGAARRALALKADADRWQDLVRALMRSAPRWSTTVAHLEALVASQARPAVAAG